MMTVSVGLPVGIVSEYGLPWQMIRPLSGILTTVLLPPEHCYPMQGLPSGCHTSSRTTVCFEWKEILLRVETDAASSRTTLGEACLACTSASTPRHETHDIGLPEDRLAHRTWNTAWCPPHGHQAFYGSVKQVKTYTVLPLQAAGQTSVGGNGSHRVFRLSLLLAWNEY